MDRKLRVIVYSLGPEIQRRAIDLEAREAETFADILRRAAVLAETPLPDLESYCMREPA